MAHLGSVDAVLVSDYNKGLWAPDLAHPLLAAARRAGKPVIINPKPSNCDCLAGAALVTLNQHEAEVASARIPPSDWPGGERADPEAPDFVDRAGETLREFFGCDSLFVTRGARGLSLFGPARHSLPAIPAEVYDGTGAGDTVVSVAAMTLSSGGSVEEAAALGVAGGALKVHKLGAVAVSRAELTGLITEGIVEVRN